MPHQWTLTHLLLVMLVVARCMALTRTRPSVRELAGMLGVSERTLRRRCASAGAGPERLITWAQLWVIARALDKTPEPFAALVRAHAFGTPGDCRKLFLRRTRCTPGRARKADGGAKRVVIDALVTEYFRRVPPVRAKHLDEWLSDD
jgi:AraC-like DNA-binding protein